MNKKCLAIFFFVLSLLCIKEARADIEALRVVLEQVGSNFPEFEKKVTEAKSLLNQTKKLTAQVKDTINQGKQIIKQGEQVVGEVKGAAEKAMNIVSEVKTAAESVKQGQIPTNLSLSEFQSLSFISNGDVSMTDSEKADATADLFLKKPEKDDIEYQRQKEEAVNQRNGNQSADQYSESFVLRQELADEKDDPQTPETVDEAQSLIQETAQKSFQRNNKITRMKAMQLDYNATNALMGLNETEDEKNEE